MPNHKLIDTVAGFLHLALRVGRKGLMSDDEEGKHWCACIGTQQGVVQVAKKKKRVVQLLN